MVDFNGNLLRLSQFVRRIISDSGMDTDPFFKKYGIGPDGKPVMAASSFAQLVNHPRHFPSTKTFMALSVTLSNATGENVKVSDLMALCNESSFEHLEDAEIGPVDGLETRANLLIREYQGLPYRERSRISPALLRQIAEDNEYGCLDSYGRVVWLLQAEIKRQTRGLEVFAREYVGIDVEVLRRILEGDRPTLTKGQLMAIACNVRDIDGNFAQDEAQARQGLFAQVLAPRLYSPRENG